jgi:uncharacterized membrane protein YfcA
MAASRLPTVDSLVTLRKLMIDRAVSVINLTQYLPNFPSRLRFRPRLHPPGRSRWRMPLVFVLVGLAAGLLSGLFGIGGGILMVPALVLLANFHTKLAIGTSLGALVLPVGILGAYTYYQNGNLSIRTSLLLSAGLILGAWLGARFAQAIPGPTLQRMFAVLLVAVAIRLWLEAGGG